MRLKIQDVARDGNGIIIGTATVNVYLAGTGTSTAANVYTTLAGTSPVNSVSTGTDGSFVFYVDAFEYGTDQTYKITISKGNFTSFTIDNITPTPIMGTYTISTAKTSTYFMKIPYGVMYTKSGSGTITFNGPFDAGLYQVFSGFSAGDVTFAAGTIDAVLPIWFGIDGSSDQTEVNLAIQAAANIGKVLLTGPTTVDGTITMQNNVVLQGHGIKTKITSTVGAGTPTIKLGDGSTELVYSDLKDLYIDLSGANDTAIGVWKRSAGRTIFRDIFILGKLNSGSQIGMLYGNGTHGHVSNLKVYGTKYPLYLDNPTGQECHDSVFDHPWLYPAVVAGAVGIYSGDYSSVGSSGDSVVAFIQPYIETDGSGTVTGISQAAETDHWVMVNPRLDGTFSAQWSLNAASRLTIIGGIETFSEVPSARTNYIGKQASQIIENLYLINSGGNEQWSVTSGGMRIGTGAGTARIGRIVTDAGSTTWDPGSLADGATATTTVAVTNADVGDVVSVGFSSITAAGWQISGQVTSSNVVTITLTNHTGGVVDLGQGTVRVVVINAPTRLAS